MNSCSCGARHQCPRLFLLDVLSAGAEDLRALPLMKREAGLQQLLSTATGHACLRFSSTSRPATTRFALSAASHLEGTVTKRGNVRDVYGRTETWVKSKCRASHEVMIGGFAKAGRQILGTSSRRPSILYVGRVGTGCGAAKAKMLLPKLKAGDAEHAPVSAKKLAEGFPRRLGASRRGGRSNETLSSRFAAMRIRAASRDWNRQLERLLIVSPKEEERMKCWLSALPEDIPTHNVRTGRRSNSEPAANRGGGGSGTCEALSALPAKPTTLGPGTPTICARDWLLLPRVTG